MAPEGSQADPEEASNANWYIAELEAEIEGLHAQIRRLKGNQSFGYVRGRGMKAPDLGKKIDTSKPRVEPIDISPHDAPHG